jgi:hypothetical protein
MISNYQDRAWTEKGIPMKGKLNNKNKKALKSVLAKQAPADLPWDDIESLVRALGGDVDRRGAGSSRALHLNGVVAVLDSPHPGPHTPKRLVKRIRKFLEQAGVSTSDV